MLPPASVKLTPPESWSSIARNFLRAAAQVGCDACITWTCGGLQSMF